MTYKELIPLLSDAERQHYYGTIELKYEQGQIVVVKRSETLKPSDFLRDTREVSGDYRRACR